MPIITTVSKRPFEVTVVACLTILGVILRITSFAVLIFIPEVRETIITFGFHESTKAILQVPLFGHYLVSGIGVPVLLATGIGLLRAQHWARIMLMLWSGWTLLFVFLTTGSIFYIKPKLLVYILMMVILFSPRAKAYFRTDKD